MSSFLAGFAAEGVKQLDQMRQSEREDKKLKEQRAYQESRYSLERADRKADNLEATNLELGLKDGEDPSRMYEGPGGVLMTTKRTVGADGNIQIDTTQVTEPSSIKRWKEYTTDKANKAYKDALGIRADEADVVIKETKAKYAGAEAQASLDAEHARAESYRKSGRGGKDSSPGHEGLVALIDSLAKNRDVVFADEAKARAVLEKNYGGVPINIRAIAQRAQGGDVKASNTLKEMAPYLTFPAKSKTD